MIFRQWFKRNCRFLGLLVLVFPAVISGQSVPDAEMAFNFGPRHQLGLNALDRTYADLDGDGSLDIAAVNGGQENPNPAITILFGTATGSFEAPIVFPSSLIGQTIVAGDLNNDGRPDLVAASWYQNKIAVFLNLGNRQFSVPVISIPPDPPYPGLPYGEFFDLAIADFDGDGNKDVVALQDQINQRLRFLHFNGNGSLTVFATLNQYGLDTSYEGEIAVGDVNGDNRPDVILANGGPFGVRTICFVYGQPVGGILSLTYGFNLEDIATGISISDLDNDGDGDMAVAFLDSTTPTRHSLQIFRNNGSGIFVALPKNFLEYPFPPDDITASDFNNDGNQDLAALLGSVYNAGVMAMVTYGRGDCTFARDKYYAASSSTSIFSADINHDNKIDILTASSFGLQSDYSAYDGVSTSTVSVMFNENFEKFRAPLVSLWGASFIDVADFNNDAYKDLVSSWASSFVDSSSVDILINDTGGGLLPEQSYASPNALNGMKTGDFNGDGKWDVISAHEDNSRVLALYLGNGSGMLAPPTNTQFSNGLLNIIVSDFNSDGRDDVFAVDDAARGYAMLGISNGTFAVAPGSPVTLPSNVPFELQKGDFNRDAKIDLVITMNSNVTLWLGDGAGRFTQSSVTIPPMKNPVPGDFNNDGKPDLAGTTGPVGTLPPWRTDNAITGVLGDGNGGFTGSFSQNIRNFSHNITQSIVTADFDLDGFDDVAMIMKDNTFGNLIIIPSGGNTPSWKQPIFYGVGTVTRTLIAADFNADGKPDLGYLGDNARGVIYNTTAAQPFRSQFDYDGDNRADLSVRRPSDNIWYVLRGTAGYFNIEFGVPGDLIAPADYDGDGKTDVCMFRPSNGTWYIFNSQSQSFTTTGWGANGDLPVPADHDGDGRADLVVFRPSTNTWYTRFANGTFASTVFGVAGDKPVVGDFDGDGKADIGLYRPSDHNWYVLKTGFGFFVQTWGVAGDIPVPADYDGDGKTDVSVFRPSTGQWFRIQSTAGFDTVNWGVSGDQPIPADYDGDGKSDVAVFRPSNSTWYIVGSTSGQLIQNYGVTGDLPTQGAYIY